MPGVTLARASERRFRAPRIDHAKDGRLKMPSKGKQSAARSFGRLHDAAGAVPPTGLVLLSLSTVQLGAAVAKASSKI